MAENRFYMVPLPLTVSMKAEFKGSLVTTRFCFAAPLEQDRAPTVITTFPSPPGGMALSKRTKQPQPGRTFLIVSSDVPTFFMINAWL